MNARYVLCALVSLTQFVNAQKPYSLPQVTPKSPNVSGLQKYGDIPVSLSTGVPNISIPLTNIEVDGLSLPITLSYHNTGLKVQEIPSMMGLGFDLQYGGVISYDQHGLNDYDLTNNGLLVSSTARQNLNRYLAGTMNTTDRYNYLEAVLNSEQDSEFDLYHFNFLGYTGTFYFDTTGVAIVMPKTDLKIAKIDTGLKVLDNAGNQFYFQAAEGSSSYEAVTTYVSPSISCVSGWYLSKIITRSGRLIRFTYKPYSMGYTKTVSCITHYPSTTGCPTSSLDNTDVLITQSFLLPDSIVFDQGYVKFARSASVRQDIVQYPFMDSIPSLTGFSVYNSSGQPVHEFSFLQGYFPGTPRLKLNGVQEKAGSEIGRTWTFRYYKDSTSFPYFFSKGFDHWGYYNGQDYNETLIPDADYSSFVANWRNYITSGYADRTSNFNYSQYGLLKTITYPTGGSTMLEYEPNQVRVAHYSDIVQYPFLRWSSGSLPTVTIPIAGHNTLFSGNITDTFTVTENTPVYATAFLENDPSYLAPASITFTGPEAGRAKLYALLSQSCTTDHCQGFGTFVLDSGTYTYTLSTGYNYDQQRTLHCNFEISRQALDTAGGLPPFELGGCRIKRVITYDSIAGIRSMTKKFIYDDSLSHVVFRNIPNYLSRSEVGVTAGFTSCVDCGTEYKIHGEPVVPYVGSTVEYGHVTELYDTSGRGGKVEHYYVTSADIGGSISGQPFVAPINTTWRAGQVAAENVYKYAGGTYTLVQSQNNDYYISDRLRPTNGIKVEYSRYCTASNPTERIHRTGLATLFTELMYRNQSTTTDYLNDTMARVTSTSAASSYHTMPTLIQSVDSKKQPVKEKTRYSFDYDTSVTPTTSEALAIRGIVRKNMLVPIEKLLIKTLHDTDYVVGGTLYTYRLDKPVLSKIYALKLAAPVLYSSFTVSSINGSGNFVKDSRYEERLIENKYDGFNNIIEQYKASDTKVTYIWDYQKYYPIAEVVNADSGSVAYTSFEADGTGDWTIASSSRDNTQGITGRSSYQLSNGSISKSGLSSAVAYTLSYWTKNSAPLTITGTVGTPQKGKTISGWTCFVHTISGVSQVALSGSGIIDELRLYPKAAHMKTYTFDPLIGMTSESDVRNSITYYEYDGFGRLTTIKDQDKNILKTVDYKYQTPQ
jgi:YD repeat-containing protein